MTERVILADCCEDWIVQWGGFYEPGRAFACPEDGTQWRKARAATYERAADGREFVLRTRRGPEDEFPYLAAADGQQPIVDRCCAKILLTHGERMQDGELTCPVCSTRWTKRTERLHGLRVPVFEKAGLAEPLTIQPGRTRPFLVGLSEHTPPRD
ncbi:MAG: hypothetical protein HYX56_07370 [Chloroflexi bacterium]|nr:hypothetical protein [Chloroflexota bacterium]